MDKMRIGVVMNPIVSPNKGGCFSYAQTLLNAIDAFDFDRRIEIINIIFYTGKKKITNYNKECLYIKHSMVSNFKSEAVKRSSIFTLPIFKNFLTTYIFRKIKKRETAKTESILKQHNIDLLYHLTPEYGLLDYPCISTHWDIAHRTTYPFPELVSDGHLENRESYYLLNLNKSFFILTESEAGLKELKNKYNFFEGKLKVMPIFGGGIIHLNIDQSIHPDMFDISLNSNEYFLYPAQFWPHKNHYTLLIAFKRFLDKNPGSKIKLVLCGSEKGNMSYIKKVIENLSLKEHVLITGFISEEKLYVLYKNAIALVMPSFLGPTNMPLIEAAHLKCPVLCSNFEGHREIMGEHALYFNPAKADEIEQAMIQIIKIDSREEWIEKAYKHISESPFNTQQSLKILNSLLLEILPVRKTWGIDSSGFFL